MEKRVIAIVSVVVLLAFVGGISYLEIIRRSALGNQQNSVVSTTDNLAIRTPEMVPVPEQLNSTYTNTNFDYSIMYPGEWSINDKETRKNIQPDWVQQRTTFMLNGDPQFSVAVTPMEYSADLLQLMKKNNPSAPITDIVVNGNNAIKFKSSESKEVVFIKTDKYTYLLSPYSSSVDEFNLMDKMIGTFKLLQ